MTRSNRLIDLARIMIKQAQMLKAQGLPIEARELARRAVEINAYGHHAMRLQPVRIRH